MVQEAREGLAVPAVRIISAFLSRDREGAGAHVPAGPHTLTHSAPFPSRDREGAERVLLVLPRASN